LFSTNPCRNRRVASFSIRQCSTPLYPRRPILKRELIYNSFKPDKQFRRNSIVCCRRRERPENVSNKNIYSAYLSARNERNKVPKWIMFSILKTNSISLSYNAFVIPPYIIRSLHITASKCINGLTYSCTRTN